MNNSNTICSRYPLTLFECKHGEVSADAATKQLYKGLKRHHFADCGRNHRKLKRYSNVHTLVGV